MERNEGARRGERRRFTPLRRQEYLEVLERTGNARAAAEAIGFSANRLRAMRRRDAALDGACAEAEAAATRRLAGVRGAFEGVEDGTFETIRRRRDGRVQIIAVGPGRWSKKIEDRFFEVLAQCGNTDASARAIGFAGTDMFRRKRQWPDFSRRMEEALDDAETRLEFLLASSGNKWVQAGEGEAPAGGGGGSERIVVPFDPEFALKFLKWREEKRRGGGRRGAGAGRGRGGAGEEPPIEQVRDEVLRRLEAMRRHREEQGDGAEDVA